MRACTRKGQCTTSVPSSLLKPVSSVAIVAAERGWGRLVLDRRTSRSRIHARALGEGASPKGRTAGKCCDSRVRSLDWAKNGRGAPKPTAPRRAAHVRRRQGERARQAKTERAAAGGPGYGGGMRQRARAAPAPFASPGMCSVRRRCCIVPSAKVAEESSHEQRHEPATRPKKSRDGGRKEHRAAWRAGAGRPMA